MKITDLEFLRCPDCLSELIKETENNVHENEYSDALKCSNCGQKYVQRNNIPHLVVEEKISERDLKFSKQADEYSSYYELAVKIMGLFILMWEPSQRKKYIKNLKIKKDTLNILDICTGPGNNLKYLKKYVGQTGKLVAMDLSEKMIEKCKKNTKRYKNPVSIQRANA
ncbi:MAG: methyltransferase domain-containing protein, partial [Candidatus Heimdallarchaeaceae archaeon]